MTIWIHPSRARFLRLFAVTAAGAVLAACAAFAPKSPEDLVRERAQARWDALLAGDFERAYGFLSPASRGVVSLPQFRASIGAAASWKSAKVHGVACEQAERCKVTMLITYSPLLPRSRVGNIETSIDEIWLLDQGQWWLTRGL